VVLLSGVNGLDGEKLEFNQIIYMASAHWDPRSIIN